MKLMLKSLIVCAFIFLFEANLSSQTPIEKKVNKGDSTRRDNTTVRNSKATKAPHFGKDLDSSRKKKSTPQKKGRKDTIYLVSDSSKRSKK